MVVRTFFVRTTLLLTNGRQRRLVCAVAFLMTLSRMDLLRMVRLTLLAPLSPSYTCTLGQRWPNRVSSGGSIHRDTAESVFRSNLLEIGEPWLKDTLLVSALHLPRTWWERVSRCMFLVARVTFCFLSPNRWVLSRCLSLPTRWAMVGRATNSLLVVCAKPRCYVMALNIPSWKLATTERKQHLITLLGGW